MLPVCKKCGGKQKQYKSGRINCIPCRQKYDLARKAGYRERKAELDKKKASGASVHTRTQGMIKLYSCKVKLFPVNDFLYLDYIELKYKQGSEPVRLRPAVRKLAEGWYVEMLEMDTLIAEEKE